MNRFSGLFQCFYGKGVRRSRFGSVIAVREEPLRNRHCEVGSAEDLLAITLDQSQFQQHTSVATVRTNPKGLQLLLSSANNEKEQQIKGFLGLWLYNSFRCWIIRSPGLCRTMSMLSTLAMIGIRITIDKWSWPLLEGIDTSIHFWSVDSTINPRSILQSCRCFINSKVEWCYAASACSAMFKQELYFSMLWFTET